ncbi:MAG: hypothetical protein HFH38_07095 [Lachnospiraceae bacterium]|jgi:uncharacterized membrane protein|nr:hypothetical protein [Lachnospiraceae bacterium]
MEKLVIFLGAAIRCFCCGIPIQADVVFTPVGGEFGNFILFAVILVAVVLLATVLLLIFFHRKDKK